MDLLERTPLYYIFCLDPREFCRLRKLKFDARHGRRSITFNKEQPPSHQRYAQLGSAQLGENCQLIL